MGCNYTLIAVHKMYEEDSMILGVRLLNNTSMTIEDIKIEHLFGFMQENEINGLGINCSGELEGTNGKLDRYACIVHNEYVDNRVVGKMAIVIIKETVNRFIVADAYGRIAEMTAESLEKYNNSDGVANARISVRDGKVVVSSIKGEFEKDRVLLKTEQIDLLKATMASKGIEKVSLTEANFCKKGPDLGDDVEKLKIPSGCLGVEKNGFAGCKAKSLSIAATCTVFKDRAFSDMVNLKEVKVPEGTKEISIEMFANCSNLETVILPNSIVKINRGAFKNCRKLKSISIGPRRPEVVLGAIPTWTKLVSRR